MEIRGLDVPGGGQPSVLTNLPYPKAQLPAILKALDAGEYVSDRFHKYREVLAETGLLIDNRFIVDYHKQIGMALYQTLFSGPLQLELDLARRSSSTVACQLQFDPEEVNLTQYPWELIHDKISFLVPMRRGIELTRYITFAQSPTPLETRLPLRVLLISPRPQEEAEFRDQAPAILRGLQRLEEAGWVEWYQLLPPTWEKLEESLYDESYDVIHFDGHGAYARFCPVCRLEHYPRVQSCVRCKADMRDATPQSYLYFEDEEAKTAPINIAEVKQVLANSETRLIFLSACGSGVVEGSSVFNGVGPALIQIGIPAVVAMQASPPDSSSVKFVERFYQSLAQGKRIPAAVNDGRLAIFRPEPGEPVSWFMPVVYLRSSDQTHGQLFKIE